MFTELVAKTAKQYNRQHNSHVHSNNDNARVELTGVVVRALDLLIQWCNQDFFKTKIKTKTSVQDHDQDYASQDQDLFVMYTRGRPKSIFHFRP